MLSLSPMTPSPFIIRRLSPFWLLLLLIGLFSSNAPCAPEPGAADTLKTVIPDSLAGDSAAQSEEDRGGVDTLINYSGDHIDFDVIRRVTVLTGSAVITYKDMRLEAERIEVDWDRHILTASGMPDTFYLDSERTAIDTITITGRPHFTQANEDFTGDEIAYNLKTKIGRVRGGSTTYEDGYYYGRQFKRLDEKVLTVTGGQFTTCENDTPHYHFAAKDLKVMVGRRVIARPVILYFEDVPCLAAPYGIFPQQHGRTSGILIPVFGESGSQGRFLRDIGYYWAISDYMDARGSVDYFERFGFLGRGNFRYTKRYTLNGNLDFDFNTQRQGSTARRDFALSAAHNQVIDPYTRLAVSGRYASNRSYVQNTGTTRDQLNQSIQSNATLSKSFEYAPWNAGVNLGYTQNLTNNTWSATLPAVNLTHKSQQLFPPPHAQRGIRGAVVPKEIEAPWYRAFQYSYSAVYRNELSMPHTRRPEALRPGQTAQAADTVVYGNDTTTVFQRDGLMHNASLSANAQLLRYFNLNPRLSLTSLWTRRAVNYVAQDSLLDREDDHGFFQRTVFDVGASMTTKLYGLAQEPLGIGASFRHVMTPSVSFTYRPDFSKAMWDYYRTITLPDGRRQTFDRFPASENIGAGGGTPTGLSESFSFGLDHLFQMKTSAEEEKDQKRFDLLAWSMRTGVDLRKDSLKWENLAMSWRTSVPGTIIGPVNGLSFDVSTSHSLYRYVDGRAVNTFYWDRPGAQWYAPVQLLNSSMNVGFSVRAETIGSLFSVGGGTEAAPPESLAVPEPYNPADVPDVPGLTPPAPGRKLDASQPSQFFDMPLTMSVNIHQTRDYLRNSKTSSFSTRTTFNLTPNWDVNFDYTFDLERSEVRNVGVSVVRDLHCWEASFQWSPLGYRPGYYQRIGLKSAQLHDVKIERHRGGGYGSYY
jgi:lipopolysaccharide assembly outer membrane protein LptD (OstA)